MKSIFNLDSDNGAALRKEAERQREVLENAVGAVMATDSGRRFVRWILSASGADRSTFSDNALRMARLAGRRDVGIEVKTFIESVCPERMDEMIKEGRNDRDLFSAADRRDRRSGSL